jgi:hypothetical protein
LGVGLTPYPVKKKIVEKPPRFWILWRRPRPKLGCGATERRRMKTVAAHLMKIF